MEKTIVLASTSPRRKELLKRMGLRFKVRPANIEENPGRTFLRKALMRVALEKAAAVAKQQKKGLIISADTVVVFKGIVYGKPGTVKKAVKMLSTLSGVTQSVWTAVAIIDKYSEKTMIRTAVSKIKMKHLSETEIQYLSRKNLDKAGGYGIQEDDKFLTVLNGSRTNIVGLPTELLSKMLKSFGISANGITKYRF
ncbi:MAG: Maf family protein [Candidatus Firestonebacteria bacterium]|nr:Maf family protein [Candidatus Firestonebacteria bacterium]